VLVDHAMGADEIWRFGQAARGHAARRIVMVTPSTRQDLQTNGAAAFTGYLVKPLRTASIAARLSAPANDSTFLRTSNGQTDCDRLVKSGPPTAFSTPSLSILVAEDNEINALLTRSLLTRLGHAVIVAANGEEALKSWDATLAAGEPYDLVLMDIQMPNLDGIEATRKIREREAAQCSRRTTILALTANALFDDRHACFEAGMDGFLVKPLDRERLTDALAEVMAVHHGPARHDTDRRAGLDANESRLTARETSGVRFD
jgi:CheY-like chemotaxis protein